jgi:carnitine O-acetyltransferase
MALRTFTKPSSVEKRLSSTNKATMTQQNGQAGNGGNHDRTSSRRRNSPKRNGTFSFQDQLPPLPIPDLEASCQKYLDALRPMQDTKEHHESRLAVREFLRYNGPELQDKLKKYATGKANYIEQFCMIPFLPSRYPHN